jgi:hypothetical protein
MDVYLKVACRAFYDDCFQNNMDTDYWDIYCSSVGDYHTNNKSNDANTIKITINYNEYIKRHKP